MAAGNKTAHACDPSDTMPSLTLNDLPQDVVHMLLTHLPLRDAVMLSCTSRILAIHSLPAVGGTIYGCAACGTPLFDPRHALIGRSGRSMQLSAPLQGGYFCTSVRAGPLRVQDLSQDTANGGVRCNNCNVWIGCERHSHTKEGGSLVRTLISKQCMELLQDNGQPSSKSALGLRAYTCTGGKGSCCGRVLFRQEDLMRRSPCHTKPFHSRLQQLDGSPAIPEFKWAYLGTGAQLLVRRLAPGAAVTSCECATELATDKGLIMMAKRVKCTACSTEVGNLLLGGKWGATFLDGRYAVWVDAVLTPQEQRERAVALI